MIGKFGTLTMIATATVAMAMSGAAASAAPTAERVTYQDDAQPRGEAPQMHVWITNYNNTWLNVQSANNNYGKWCDSNGQKPESPRPIPPKADKYKAFCSQGRQNSPTGTEGEVTYVFANDSSKWFTIKWDVPYLGANSMSVNSAGGVVAQCEGFSSKGNVQKVHCKVGAFG